MTKLLDIAIKIAPEQEWSLGEDGAVRSAIPCPVLGVDYVGLAFLAWNKKDPQKVGLGFGWCTQYPEMLNPQFVKSAARKDFAIMVMSEGYLNIIRRYHCDEITQEGFIQFMADVIETLEAGFTAHNIRVH